MRFLLVVCDQTIPVPFPFRASFLSEPVSRLGKCLAGSWRDSRRGDAFRDGDKRVAACIPVAVDTWGGTFEALRASREPDSSSDIS